MGTILSLSVAARVQDALEAVYHEFKTTPPSSIEGCPCCIGRVCVDVLLTERLRELPGQALWSYVSSVFYTVGSEHDFHYLLPRILDISVNRLRAANHSEIVLRKVGLAYWKYWSRKERQVIDDFVDAWFASALDRDVAGAVEGWIDCEAEGVLCGAALAQFPLARWLSRLQQPAAAPVLLDLKRRFPGRLSAFWEQTPTGYKEFAAFMTDAVG